MNKFFGLMRYSKKLLAIAIVATINLLLIAGICVFDIIEMLIVLNNHAKISSAFLPLNILLIVLTAFSIISIIILLIFNKKRGKENGLF